jgi:hypothetical protein
MWSKGSGAGLIAIVALVLALGAGSAVGAGSKKLVEGTVYDTTCATSCMPECPPPPECGPITAQSRTAVVCAQPQRMIVCPLATAPRICLPASSCGSYPVYSGEGAIINVRRRGSPTVIASLPVVEGHFKLRLAPGNYIAHPYLPEEECWSGAPAPFKVTANGVSPIALPLYVSNSCVAHPDAR